MAGELTTLEKINLYCDSKEAEKTLNKDIKALNDKIKQEMINGNAKEVCTDKYIVTLETRTKDEIDPLKLLIVLKKYWQKDHPNEPCPFIKQVEIIDEDALEGFIYRNSEALPESLIEDINKCRTKTVTNALTYKKIKGK
jgi:P2-related tail formation protein